MLVKSMYKIPSVSDNKFTNIPLFPDFNCCGCERNSC